MRTVLPKPPTNPTVGLTNVTYTVNSGSVSFDEYFRFVRFGKLVIIDVGGCRATSGSSFTLTNVPKPIQRLVPSFWQDNNGSTPSHMYWYNSINNSYSIKSGGGRGYGQFCYLTDDP